MYIFKRTLRHKYFDIYNRLLETLRPLSESNESQIRHFSNRMRELEVGVPSPKFIQ